jgi:hypothetical protein
MMNGGRSSKTMAEAEPATLRFPSARPTPIAPPRGTAAVTLTGSRRSKLEFRRVRARESDPSQLEQLLGEPVAHATRAVWGFQNRTDIVTLATGDRVVVQRYRRRADAEHRLRVMESLRAPAAAVGIAVPRVRDSEVDADPSWIAFDALPGVPIPEAGDAAPGERASLPWRG